VEALLAASFDIIQKNQSCPEAIMKMKAVLILILFLMVSVPALALDFSADVENRIKGERPMTGEIFITGEKIRMDMAGSATITRIDKKVVWVLMPEQKMYMEQPIRPENMAQTGKPQGELERKFIANESVEGRAAKKYLVTYKTDNKKDSVYQWIDNMLQIPTKVESVDGKWSMVYKNIKIGPQKPDLFEVPKGYKKFSMPAMPKE
jgi:hypothetical protein